MGKVTLDHVCKTYPGDVTVVRDVSLEVQDKEFLVLVGPSGCGKSTTLRMVAGLEDISSGTISIDGRVVNTVPPKDRDIAMVFQNYALYPHMSVYDNMAYGLKMRGYGRGDIDARVREAAGILGITEYLARKPKALSGGQRQRVAVGRAIVRKPKVFLFDEPLSNLDAKMRVQMRAEISKLHRRLEATILYVTHDQVEAMTMGSRIVVMHGGVIQQIAPPLELYHHPVNRFVAGFIGSPPMNFFEGVVRHDGQQLLFDAGSFTLRLTEQQTGAFDPVRERPVVLGVRPSDVMPAARAPDHLRCFSLEARAEVIEPMGDEVYVHLNPGSGPFVAKLADTDSAEIGQPLPVCFNMEKARFFDQETEHTII